MKAQEVKEIVQKIITSEQIDNLDLIIDIYAKFEFTDLEDTRKKIKSSILINDYYAFCDFIDYSCCNISDFQLEIKINVCILINIQPLNGYFKEGNLKIK